MTVFFGYGRVSTDTQSTDNQRVELAQAGYPIPDEFWFSDHGVSGKTRATQRPEFSNLLTRIRSGETLVVSKLDRLGRDAVDVMQTIRLLGDRNVKPTLTDLATGAVLRVPSFPKTGSMRQTGAKMQAGRIYFMLFANTGMPVKSGSRVTVTVGDFNAEGLVVQ